MTDQELAAAPEVPGYEIERVLGRGGMGVVYLARQERLNRHVALKVIIPELATDELFRHRFEQEAEHAASIDHPNVVPIYEANEAGGSLYLAMRYVDGDDLGSILRQTSGLPVYAAARIVEQVASALDAAHARGLVHRDVKPANILIEGGRPDGHVYLTDFGLTKTAETQASLTHTGRFVGTLDYAAPEQIEGGVTDARTDVYALACVLWHSLTGEPPYEGGDAQKMWAHMHHDPPSFSTVKPKLADDFDPIIARGMAKIADERYPSAGDLGRAAVAAAGGPAIEVSERSVATGVAAAGIPTTKTASVARPAAPTRDVPLPAPQEPVTVVAAPAKSSSGSRVILAGLVVLLVIAAAGAGAFLVATRNNETVTTEAKVAARESNQAQRAAAKRRAARERQRRQANATTQTPTATSEPVGGGSTSAAATATDQTQLTSYSPSDSTYAYKAKLPQGGGWLAPAETYPTGGALLRTSVRGPGGQFVIIDRTPYDVPQLGGGFDSSGVLQHPIYGQAIEYVISDSELIPECNGSQCVDYLIDDGNGGGWGVLAGGPDLGAATQMAQDVALSVGSQ